MIRHYLTFAHEARLLHRLLTGGRITGCWAQEKDRVLLAIDEGSAEERGVEFSIDLRFGYALPLEEIHRPRRNRVDLFGSIEGRRITECDVDPHERAIRIGLNSGMELVIPFYGPGGGNILLVKKAEVRDSYRKIENEYDTLLVGPVESEDSRELPRELPKELPLAKSIMRLDRRLGPRLVNEAAFRHDVDPKRLVSEVSAAEIERVRAEVARLYDEAAESRLYHIYRKNDGVIFSLVRLSSVESDRAYERDEYGDLPEAIRRSRALYFRTERHRILRGRLLSTAKKEIARLEKSLAHASDTEAHLERADGWEKDAQIVLGNLHAIERGSEVVRLDDWEGGVREIRLKKTITPAENADRYFRKARGARMEAERGIGRAETLRAELDRLREVERRAEELSEIDHYDELEGLAKGIIREEKSAAEKENREDRFRRFRVEGGLEVFAGKNARNNDELTGRFTRPNDIWLHARGTSGSHVVLRWGNTDENPPGRALEQSAMIAAYYSGSRGSGLVPVAWTRRKYVRKPKGAAPGAVVMTREEVILVEPKLPRSVTGGA